MTLIEEYYELNEAEEVSVLWKVIQILFYVFAACTGLWCGFTMGNVRDLFDGCYLYTSISVAVSKNGSVDSTSIEWQIGQMCDYCQYSMVFSFIAATIWATFFLMCGKGGKSLTGLPQPWRIVWPSFVFNFMYFLISLATAINIQKGTEVFCSKEDLPKTKHINKCHPLEFLIQNNLNNTAILIDIIPKSAWACASSWFILTLIPFFRIVFVIDFQPYKICVFKIDDTIHNKREEVLRITNYEEPKKLYMRQTTGLPAAYSDYAEHPEETDRERVVKTKFDKTVTAQYSTRSPLQPNTGFYVMADIRMLNRGKKRNKSFDEPLDKNNGLPGNEIRRTNKLVPNLNDAGGTGYSQFLQNYSSDNEGKSTPSTIENTEYVVESWEESDSDSEIFQDNLERQQSIAFKKQM